MPIIQKILQNPRYDAPKLEADPVTDFYAFTKDSFRLVGYRYTDLQEKIPVAI